MSQCSRRRSHRVRSLIRSYGTDLEPDGKKNLAK
jgi:hypothetical protein